MSKTLFCLTLGPISPFYFGIFTFLIIYEFLNYNFFKDCQSLVWLNSVFVPIKIWFNKYSVVNHCKQFLFFVSTELIIKPFSFIVYEWFAFARNKYKKLTSILRRKLKRTTIRYRYKTYAGGEFSQTDSYAKWIETLRQIFH